MKRKVFKHVFCATIVSVGCIIGYQSTPDNNNNELLSDNVEALSQTDQPKPITYSSIHTPCYELITYGETKVLQETGEYKATCYENPNSQKTLCHSHSCSSCSSD